jgi:hypothetical protein
MMEPFWVRVGERAGYAVAAILLGPYAAALRHERRLLRRAFHGWLDDLDATRLEALRTGTSRRSASLRGTSPIPFDAELDVVAKRAHIDAALSLAKDVTAEITKARWMLDGVTVRFAGPVTIHRRVLVDATNLDEGAANELASEVAATAIGRLDTFRLQLQKDRVMLDVVAPRDADTWVAIEKALAVLVESWSTRFSSYR